MRMLQITEDDLATLEHILPLVFWKLTCTPDAQPVDRANFERVKAIMSNVRWQYGPPREVTQIPAEGGGDGPT